MASAPRRLVAGASALASTFALLLLAGCSPDPAAHAAVPAQVRVIEPVAVDGRIALPDGGRLLTGAPGEADHRVLSILETRQQMKYGDFVWNDKDVPAGPLWIRVDVAKQMISVFRGGHEIGAAVILYGGESKETPTGVFPILQKAADYHSQTYDAPMPYMLRLTRDGVAIHASNVREGWATHGCVGVPMEFAERLFAEAKLGDQVSITDKAA